MNIYQYFSAHEHFFESSEAMTSVLSAIERVMSETVSEHFINFFDETKDVEKTGFLKHSSSPRMGEVVDSSTIEIYFELSNNNEDLLRISLGIDYLFDEEMYKEHYRYEEAGSEINLLVENMYYNEVVVVYKSKNRPSRFVSWGRPAFDKDFLELRK